MISEFLWPWPSLSYCWPKARRSRTLQHMIHEGEGDVEKYSLVQCCGATRSKVEFGFGKGRGSCGVRECS